MSSRADLIKMALDWQAIALRQAADQLGTPEGRASLVESNRYGLLREELEKSPQGAWIEEKDLERWKECINTIAACSTKKDRCSHAIYLKQEIADILHDIRGTHL